MGSITISAGAGILISLASGFVILKSAWDIIKPMLHPEADLRKTVTEHSTVIADNLRRLEALERSFLNEQGEAEEFRAVMCMSMQAQFDHVLSGNDIAYIRQARDRLNSYLSNGRR